MSLSAETRAKISAALKGNRNAKGRQLGADARKRISTALKGNKNCLGVKRSAATKAKISAAMNDKRAAEKRRLNLRIAHRVIKLFKPEAYAARAENARRMMLEKMKDPAYVERLRAGQRGYRERHRLSRAAPPAAAPEAMEAGT